MKKSARLNRSAAARLGAKSPGRQDSEFIHGDAQHIPFPENAFDVVTIGYGLRNLADLDAGLRDMLRVTRPGGRLVALEFGKPANGFWRGIYFGYLKFMLPIFGKVFCGNSAAYGYILESLSHYPAQQAVAERIWRGLGWQNVRVINSAVRGDEHPLRREAAIKKMPLRLEPKRQVRLFDLPYG